MATADTTVNKQEDKFADLVGPTDPSVDREAREKLVTARVGMLLRASFFGNLATRLKITNADEWCPTAATDGRHFYYNSRFVEMLKPKEIEFLFGHEVLHCVYDHFGRRGDRDPMLWNIANDYAVNADLKKHRVGEFITTVPCLYDLKYEGWMSEEIYDDLYEQADKIDMDQMMDQMIDQHLDGESGSGEEGEGKGPVQLSDEERQQIRDEIKEAMLQAAQASDAGNIPGGVKRMIQQLTEPKLNWRELLAMQLESTIRSDYTFAKVNRRGWHMDAVLPGMRNDDMIDIAIAMDMSGSIGDAQGRDFLSEVQGIMGQFDQYRIHLFTFDTQCYNPQQFDSDNLEEITEYDLQGGGGTDFDAIFEYLKEEQIEPKRLVVFTDMMPWGSWGDENYCDTVWINHGSPGTVAPFGVTADYSEA